MICGDVSRSTKLCKRYGGPQYAETWAACVCSLVRAPIGADLVPSQCPWGRLATCRTCWSRTARRGARPPYRAPRRASRAISTACRQAAARDAAILSDSCLKRRIAPAASTCPARHLNPTRMARPPTQNKRTVTRTRHLDDYHWATRAKLYFIRVDS